MSETEMVQEIKKVKRPAGTTITLCMIVKNESHIIRECLESMLPYIDRYDITDTGSDDGTPELIKEFFDQYNVPGEVYLSDWKGFGKSRSESLLNVIGKATYAWVIDADDIISGNFKYPNSMTADSYSLRLGRPDFSWFRNQIFKIDKDRQWEYTGVLHEYAQMKDVHPSKVQVEKISGDYYVVARTLGARNVGIDPVEKYTKDAEVLISALTNEDDPNYEPKNVRYQFYLGQSYFDSQQWDKAEEAYIKRAEMGGWEEEVWFSMYRVAIIKAVKQKPWHEVKEAYLEAWNFRPTRAEPLYEIARAYRSMDKPRLAWIYAKQGCEIPYPQNDILFIGQDIYDWKMLDEFGSTAFYANDYHNGFQACNMLMSKIEQIPEEHQGRIKENYSSYRQQLEGMHAHNQAIIEQQKAVEKADKKEEKQIKSQTPKKSTKTEGRKGFKEKKKR